MDLILEILNGELKGKRYGLRDGLRLGRRDSDITLQDPKVSGKHARVEQRSDGSYWLIDQGSSNGIKLVEGSRVLELPLLDGSVFLLGRTQIKVISRAKKGVKTPKTPQGRAPRQKAIKTPPPAEIEAEIEIELLEPPAPSWWDELKQLMRRASETTAPQKEIAPFQPPLRLRVIQGIQTGTEWILGYGPRESGAASVDLPIEEPGASDVCFRLLPQHDCVLIKVEDEDGVRLNGKTVESAFLQDGDVIEIKNTHIRVEYEAVGEK